MEKVIKYSDLKIGMVVSLAKNSPPAFPESGAVAYDDCFLDKGTFGLITQEDRYGYVVAEVLCKDTALPKSRYIQNKKSVFVEVDPSVYNDVRKKVWSKIGLPPSYTGKHWFIGSDPEIFVLNDKDVVIPAWEYLPSKDEAFRKADLGVHKAISFWDGFQAEFGIFPAPCHEEVISNIQRGLDSVLSKAREKFPKARLTHLPVVDIPKKLMEETSYEHAALGCAPSTNVYKDVRPLRVEDPKDLPFRFAGCHVHMGCLNKNEDRLDREKRYDRIVKGIDALFGIISVPLLQGLEDVRRRKFYGMAGEYRTPPHGIEYRVGSSAILVHPIATFLAFDFARLAAKLASEDVLDSVWESPPEQKVREIINELDIKSAQKVIVKNKTFLEKALYNLYYRSENSKIVSIVMDLLINGVKNKLPTDIEKNWLLCTNKFFSVYEPNIKVMNIFQKTY